MYEHIIYSMSMCIYILNYFLMKPGTQCDNGDS